MIFMTTNLEVKQFKQAAKKLQQMAEAGKFKNEYDWTCGICYMLSCITENIVKDTTEDSYDIMSKLLTKYEYHNGLGADGDFNTNREVFLEFLAYTLSEKDIQEICNNKG